MGNGDERVGITRVHAGEVRHRPPRRERSGTHRVRPDRRPHLGRCHHRDYPGRRRCLRLLGYGRRRPHIIVGSSLLGAWPEWLRRPEREACRDQRWPACLSSCLTEPIEASMPADLADANSIRIALMVAAAAVAVVLDVRERRIPNALTLPLAAAGLGIGAVSGGLGGLMLAIAGCVAGGLLFLIPVAKL